MTKSAAFFAVRVLTDPEAPPSAGAFRPVEVIAPEGSLLNARPPAAVAAGNVETSSRVADLVIDALAGATPAPAQGQGTMNNLTLANNEFTYYETLGGGQGACPDADGPSAVHVAMSNTLNTPIEALETEFPLRVAELSVRRGSGGAGRHRGGDGIVRELEALSPMSYTLITERRRHAPRGRDGGADGEPGRNLLNGEPLASKAAGELAPRRPAADRDAGGRRLRPRQGTARGVGQVGQRPRTVVLWFRTAEPTGHRCRRGSSYVLSGSAFRQSRNASSSLRSASGESDSGDRRPRAPIVSRICSR